MPDQPMSSDPLTAFGPNEWLVDELFEQALERAPTERARFLDAACAAYFVDDTTGSTNSRLRRRDAQAQ